MSFKLKAIDTVSYEEEVKLEAPTVKTRSANKVNLNYDSDEEKNKEKTKIDKQELRKLIKEDLLGPPRTRTLLVRALRAPARTRTRGHVVERCPRKRSLARVPHGPHPANTLALSRYQVSYIIRLLPKRRKSW